MNEGVRIVEGRDVRLIRIAQFPQAPFADVAEAAVPAFGFDAAPGARGDREMLLERPGERFAGAEADFQGHVENAHFWMAGQLIGSTGQAASAQVVAQGFADPGGEQAMKVKGRKMRDLREFRQLQRLVQVLVDILQHPVHALGVFVEAVIGGAHGAKFSRGPGHGFVPGGFFPSAGRT